MKLRVGWLHVVKGERAGQCSGGVSIWISKRIRAGTLLAVTKRSRT